jgi:hypothetical protein
MTFIGPPPVRLFRSASVASIAVSALFTTSELAASCFYQTVGTRSRISDLPRRVRWYWGEPATAAIDTDL